MAYATFSKSMKKFGIALAALFVLAVLAYGVFDRLGGNNPVELELVTDTSVALAGKTFRGTPQDEKLSETFRHIETLLPLHPGKKMHMIYLVEPAGKLDTMEVFVGLDLPFAPADLESKIFSEKKFIVATIRANKWVMPGPERVKEKIQRFASENQVTLSGIFIDKIISEEEVQVIAPVK